jgi:glucose-6-phosphate 1-dehydrogenase
MIGRLVVFGATGDLTGRFLLPALAQLVAAGSLQDGFSVLGAAEQDWDDARFRRHAAERLEEYAGDVPVAVRDALVARLWYRKVDVTDADAVRAALRLDVGRPGGAPPMEADRPVAAYLALPTALVPPTVTACGAAGLPAGSRIAIEKPFGEDLAGAQQLNSLLARVLGDGWVQRVFRVDHALGMSTVQGLLPLRFRNRVLDELWSGKHIEEIQVLWEETLALEGRAAFYDRSGALKDVMQNHLMQVLCMVGVEPPSGPADGADQRSEAAELSRRKVDFLRAVRELSPADVLAGSRRARYTAGRLANTGGAEGGVVPDYADEDGVDPGRSTETFAEVVLRVDTPRWTGASFRLRAGKALAERRKGVLVRFRPVPGTSAAGDELWIGVDGPNDVRLCLSTAAGPSGTPARPQPAEASARLVLGGPQPESGLSPYARVLLDLLAGSSELSVGSEEAEQAWRILTPVLDAWSAGRVPLEEYAAGSQGPHT